MFTSLRISGWMLAGMAAGFFWGECQAEPSGAPESGTELRTAPATVYPFHFEDARRRAVVLERAPRRIVSLAPSLTETVFALGAGERLVADTPHCIRPEAARSLPKVGGSGDSSVEALVRLKPDLVLAAALTPPEVLRQLEKTGFVVAVFRQQAMEESLAEMSLLGRILDAAASADALVAETRRRFAAVEKAAAELPHPRTLLLYGSEDLFSCGENTFSGRILSLAGARNIAAGLKSDWPRLSLEHVILQNPEVILLAGDQDGAKGRDAVLARWRGLPGWRSVEAVKTGRVFVVGEALLSIPGPRMAEALETVASLLQSQGTPPSP